MEPQRRTWHNFLLVWVPVCFCVKFYVNWFCMAESKSIPDAPQPACGPYHQLNRSVTVLNRVLQIFCGPLGSTVTKEGAANGEA